jgi:hypothetical protein
MMLTNGADQLSEIPLFEFEFFWFSGFEALLLINWFLQAFHFLHLPYRSFELTLNLTTHYIESHNSTSALRPSAAGTMLPQSPGFLPAATHIPKTAASNGILAQLDPNTIPPSTRTNNFRPPLQSPLTSARTPFSIRSSFLVKSPNTPASGKWKSQTTLEAAYQTGERALLGKEVPKEVLQEETEKGTKDLNLWTNGLIYPPNPSTGRPPEFSGLTSALRFVENGENGLLGYTKELDSARQRAEDGLDRHRRDFQPTVQNLLQQASEQREQLSEKDKALADALKLAEKFRLEAEANAAGKAKAVAANFKLSEKLNNLSTENQELKVLKGKNKTRIVNLLRKCNKLSQNGRKLPRKKSKDIGKMAGSGGAAMERKHQAR